MTKLSAHAFVATTAMCMTLAASAEAATTVELQIEGASETIYEGTVTTGPKSVSQGGHEYRCDGTNGGANAAPGATMTSALDDGRDAGDYSWEGTWHDSLEDFFIDRIGPDRSSTTAYWGLALNWTSTDRGGCQTRVLDGDRVLFAYDAFTKSHFLRLDAPRYAAVGEQVRVRVTDGGDEAPIAGASVGDTLTGPDGSATLTFQASGMTPLKAERADSVRSNRAVVCVYEPGTEPCPAAGGGQEPGEDPDPATPPPAEDTGPFERTPPVARIVKPLDGALYRRGPRRIRGRALDRGSGIEQAFLSLVRRHAGRCRAYRVESSGWARRRCGRARYGRIGNADRWTVRLSRRLRPGRYNARTYAIDRAGNRSRTDRVRFKVATRAGI